MASTGTRSKAQFDALHGLRGLAAIAVVLRHTAGFTRFHPAQSSYLAVDLFFVLSGFVISHAYDRRLRAGQSFLDFSVARLQRLYPLYLLGIVLALPSLAKPLLSGGYSVVFGATSLLFQVLFLPVPSAISAYKDTAFPLNMPSWSLFFELAINAVYALVGLRMAQRQLAVVVLISAAMLIAAALSAGSLDGGGTWPTLYVGAARVTFGFSMGVYLRRYRFSEGGQVRRFSHLIFAVSLAIVAGVMIVPNTSELNTFFDLFVAIALWPMLVITCSMIQLKGTCARLAHYAGEMSYPAYVLHMPVLIIGSTMVDRVFGLDRFAIPAVAPYVFTVAFAAAALVINYTYDTPIRRWLGERRLKAITQF